MSKAKKIGIILVLIGIGLPLMSLAFVENVGYWPKFIDYIRFGKIYLNKSYIQYNYIFAFSVFSVFTGIGFIALSKR